MVDHTYCPTCGVSHAVDIEHRCDMPAIREHVASLRAEVSRLGGELKKAQALLAYTQGARLRELEVANGNFIAICNEAPYHSPAYGVAFDAAQWAANRKRANLELEMPPAPAHEESER